MEGRVVGQQKSPLLLAILFSQDDANVFVSAQGKIARSVDALICLHFACFQCSVSIGSQRQTEENEKMLETDLI